VRASKELARTTQPGAADRTGFLHRLVGRAGPVQASEKLAQNPLRVNSVWRDHLLPAARGARHTPCAFENHAQKPLQVNSARRRRSKGGALLMVLWLSAALAAIGWSVSTTVRAETERVGSAADGLRAWYLASGAVERGIQWMLWAPEDHRNPDGSPRFWAYNQPRLYMSFPSGSAVVEMIPEQAKMNINSASADQLYKLVLIVSGNPATASQITAAILDWRSPSGSPTLFDQYYFSFSPTFRSRHASFEQIEELLLVRGMTPELFYGNYVSDADGRLYASGGLRDCLSVWGSSGPYDVNGASPALMESMGVPPGAVAAIVERRRVQPFRSMGELQGFGPLPGMGIGGNVIWTLRATARLRRPDGSPSDTVRTAAAVVKLLNVKTYPLMPLHVLRWYDDAWSQTAVAPFAGMPRAAGNVAPAIFARGAGMPGQPGGVGAVSQ